MATDLPQPTEIEFREGVRVVPEYLVPHLRRLETYRMSYEEALGRVNEMLVSDNLKAQQDKILSAHFRQRPG